jgi:hypothetical protein
MVGHKVIVNAQQGKGSENNPAANHSGCDDCIDFLPYIARL